MKAKRSRRKWKLENETPITILGTGTAKAPAQLLEGKAGSFEGMSL